MDAGQRKLLPYEYQLIDALGITKEEYLGFIAYQGIYRDVKQDTELDIRNWETAAIVISIIGMLASAASIVFAPKPPQLPEVGGGFAGRREARFAPRFGFNSQQPLAAYGEPINLIYANQELNPYGGVRAASSLIWSAVRSYGNSQFVELLMILAGGKIGKINNDFCAFGQTPLRDLISENYWIYFQPNQTGALSNASQLPSSITSNGTAIYKTDPADPSAYGSTSSNPYRVRFGNSSTKEDGFSQAYSPTNSTEFGVYAPVPINVIVKIRTESGDFANSKNVSPLNGGNGVIVNGGSGWPDRLYNYKKGDSLEVVLYKAADKGFIAVPASDQRQGFASAFDNAGVFKLGAAQFKVTKVSGNILESDMKVTLKCIEKGKGSSVEYKAQDVTKVIYNTEELTPQEFKQVRRIALRMLRLDDRLVNEDTGEIVTSSSVENARQLNAAELAEQGNIRIIKKKKLAKKIGNWTYETPGDALPKILQKGGYVNAKGDITEEGKLVLTRYAELSDANSKNVKDNYFFIKALTRIEQASYETISPCSIVDFALKARIFKNVSGRQTEYGSEQRNSGYKQSDNGQKMRTAMFTVKFKYAGQKEYTYFPGIFTLRRTGDIDNYVYLRFRSHLNPRIWQFQFTPVFDIEAEVASHSGLKDSNGNIKFHYIDNIQSETNVVNVSAVWKDESVFDSPLPDQSESGTALNQKWLDQGAPLMEFCGRTRSAASKFFPPVNRTPRGMNEWDLFTVASDNNVNYSFDNGPEFKIVAVTEQTVESFKNYPELYSNLSLIGLNMYSGRSIQDLRSFTVFVEKGKWGKVIDSVSGAVEDGYPCHAPDIFYDTAIDKIDGIGQYSSDATIDLQRLKASKKFCEANSFFMEGLISDEKSWRAFWAEVAPFSMLELAKIGGKDTLIPAVPYTPDGKISIDSVNVVALFNQGNILEGSYKEEFVEFGDGTQDTVVSAIYREQKNENASSGSERIFAVNTSVEVRYKDSDQASITTTTLDMSQYVSRRDQAIKIAKFICALKRYTTKNIEFQTFPTSSAVAPGDYIYVELAQNKWNQIYSGVIGPGGVLNTAFDNPVPLGSSMSFLIYNPNTANSNTSPVSASVSQDSAGNYVASALSNYEGQLFIMGALVKNKRIFKVLEVAMEEEGETTIRATEFATDSEGRSRINQDLDKEAASKWLVDGK